MKCRGCNKEKEIKNSFHKLCLICNNKRLEANKKPKVDKFIKKKSNSNTTQNNRRIRKVTQGERVRRITSRGKRPGKNFELDEIFYEESFNRCKDHSCEECGKNLPSKFRSEDGKVMSRFRYSHIIPKSIAPELRHNLNNINHLCHKCHFEWDFGDKKSMDIYDENRKKFPQYLK